MEHPLRIWLKKNDVTATKLAETCGVTPGRISQIMNGELPSMDLASNIKAATNGEVTADDFLSHRDEASSEAA